MNYLSGVATLLCVSLLSCHTASNEQGLSGHLSTDLVHNPRSLNDDHKALQQMGHLTFPDTLHDFGRIQEGEVLEHDFEFENNGKQPLLISDAKASCGCTVPSFPQQPIAPGEKNKIKVTFNSEGKKGQNQKMIIITTNGNPSTYNLYIRSDVVPK